MSNDGVRQHFVPQFLLRNFAEGRKNKARLWVFDKHSGKSFRSNVRDVGHENLFYEAKNIDGHHLKAEPLTQRIDTAGGAVISDIIKDGRLRPNLDSRVNLALFLGVQLVRRPGTRNMMIRLKKRILEKWCPEIHFKDDPRSVSAYSDEDDKHTSITALEDVPEYAKLLHTKVWFLTRSSGPTRFIPSDDPLVPYNQIQNQYRGMLGLSKIGIEFRFPLTPRLCLNLVCPTVAQELGTRMGNASPPAQRTSFRAPSNPFAPLAKSPTCAPSFANATAVGRPTPAEAPVTTTASLFLLFITYLKFACWINIVSAHPELKSPVHRLLP